MKSCGRNKIVVMLTCRRHTVRVAKENTPKHSPKMLLFLVAITANTQQNAMRLLQRDVLANQEPMKSLDLQLQHRASSTLEAIKSRMWKDKWPLVTEGFLKETGPWVLKPYEYHNRACWPWIAAVEMMARARLDRIEECDTMLSAFTSQGGNPELHAFYEWIDLNTNQGHGAFPFRTGLSTLRIVVIGLLFKIMSDYSSRQPQELLQNFFDLKEHKFSIESET